MNLKEKVKGLPSTPGVYLMKDSLNSVIYVGKSKNLKSRVGSYFQDLKSHSPKVVKLVNNLKDFEYILTDTEFEAFMLECKLIKEIKPMYNKLMKSPKSYAYIKVDKSIPDIRVSNETDASDGNLYFGPYSSKNTVERGLQGIKECCRILCGNNSGKASSCLNYSLGLCIGICQDDFPKEQYVEIIERIIALLNGTDRSIIYEMESKMSSASEKFDFETAAKYRDYISAVNYLINKSTVIKFTKKNKNIALTECLNEDTIKLFLINGSKVIFTEKYNINDIGLEKLKDILKSKILYFFNNKGLKKSIVIGKEEIDEAQIIYSYLKNTSAACKYAVIPNTWLNSPESMNFDKALNKLLDNIN